MIGVMSLRDALTYAKDRSLDLVEMSASSNPPTCRIMDYGKWKFENKKKEKQNRKKQVKVLIKELQLRPRTDENDINIKLQKAREFLEQGHKVKINVLFSGREMAHKELGFKLLQRVEEKISDMAFIETPVKMERRSLFTIFASNTSSAKPAPSIKSSTFPSSTPKTAAPIVEIKKSTSASTPKTAAPIVEIKKSTSASTPKTVAAPIVEIKKSTSASTPKTVAAPVAENKESKK